MKIQDNFIELTRTLEGYNDKKYLRLTLTRARAPHSNDMLYVDQKSINTWREAFRPKLFSIQSYIRE